MDSFIPHNSLLKWYNQYSHFTNERNTATVNQFCKGQQLEKQLVKLESNPVWQGRLLLNHYTTMLETTFMSLDHVFLEYLIKGIKY